MKWWQNTICYEIYPKSFQDTDGDGIGNLKGVTRHLDYLKSLGVGGIWLTPVYRSPMVDNGYDIQDYYEIDPSFGTMADMEELIEEGKKRGIRIIMDLVFNHSSDQNAWFVESAKDRTNPKADWYIWRDPKEDGSAPNNWRGIFGGSVWTYCESRGQYYMHTFAAAQPDLNWENPEVRKALFDVANFWIHKGVGGFRIDAIPYIKKPADFGDGEPDGIDGMVNVHHMTANREGILDFLHEMKKEVCEGKDVFTVAEANGVGPDDLKYWVGEEGVFDMVFEFSHVDLDFEGMEYWCRPRNWPLTELKHALSASQAATRTNGWLPVFFENHDCPRGVNRYFPWTDIQKDHKEKAKVLGTLALTLRGTPFLYQGQELGCDNVTWDDIDKYNDIYSHTQYQFALNEGCTKDQAIAAVKRFSRDNARTPMHWNDGPNAGFTEGTPWQPLNDHYLTINVSKEDGDPSSVLSWYRTLAALRKEHPALTKGTYEEILPEHEQIFAYRRTCQEEDVVILLNFSDQKVSLDPLLWEEKTLLLNTHSDFCPSCIEPFQAVVLQSLSARI